MHCKGRRDLCRPGRSGRSIGIHTGSLHVKLKTVRKRHVIAGFSTVTHSASQRLTDRIARITMTHPPPAEVTAEVAIVGAGPAGLVSAIALAAAGVDTLLIASPAQMDHRTTALLAGSVAALDTLGVWEGCLPHAAPLKKLRIIDDTRRLFRAPEVLFTAAEIDCDAFGYNIENRHLMAALQTRAATLPLTWIAAPALAIECDASVV